MEYGAVWTNLLHLCHTTLDRDALQVIDEILGDATPQAHRGITMKELVCDALLFDLDGVLIDSSPAIVRNWQKWADRHNIDMAAIMRVMHGVRSVETIRQVAPHLDADAEAAWLTAVEVTDTEGVMAMPGARQLLAALPVDAWTIVTSGSRDLAQARLRTAALPIPTQLVTADDVTQGKPAPEPYLSGARRLGLAPARCLVIEDAPAGVQAGRSAGMQVLSIASTHAPDELLAIGATAVVDRIADLRVTRGDGGYRLAVQW